MKNVAGAASSAGFVCGGGQLLLRKPAPCFQYIYIYLYVYIIENYRWRGPGEFLASPAKRLAEPNREKKSNFSIYKYI